MINEERLAQIFSDLVVIDSVSGEEGRCCDDLQQRLTALGLETTVDDIAEHIKGQCGNLIARYPGRVDTDPLLLSAHMDTVEPGRGIAVQFMDGVFSSKGDTILGADDKSALAVILEVLHCITERDLACPPLEVVFSVCEEIGLVGAKHLDFGRITARKGYVLDSGNPEVMIVRAPSEERLTFIIHGRSAHAGVCPEAGINAIKVAAQAIARMPQGRIDNETTSNVGIIEGGLATNIVADRVRVEVEARSHDDAKLEAVVGEIMDAFTAAVAAHNQDNGAGAHLEIIRTRDFTRMAVDPQHPVVTYARQAAGTLGVSLELGEWGGGSDANVFAEHGIVTAVLGTGMENVHSTRETIRLADMVHSAELLLETVLLHNQSEKVKDDSSVL